LRQILGLYIKDLKSAKAEVNTRLKTSESQVTGLEKDLEAARLSIKKRERELASLTYIINTILNIFLENIYLRFLGNLFRLL
jgi:chromosome segregation ATPase